MQILNESDRMRPVGPATFHIDQDVAELSARRPVRASRLNVRKVVRPHDHAYTELCFVVEGSALHRDDTGAAELRSGDVVAVPPGAVHAFERPRGFTVYNVYHLSEWLLSDLPLLRQTPPLGELVSTRHAGAPAKVWRWSLAKATRQVAWRELEAMATLDPSVNCAGLMQRAMLLKLLALIASDFPRGEGEAMSAEVQLTLEAIERAVAGGQLLRMDEVARVAGCSADHATRQFRAWFDEPPTQYFQRRRSQHTAALLLDGRRAIGQIAHACGYADAAHLVRHFRRHFGITPSEYRNLYADPSLPG